MYKYFIGAGVVMLILAFAVLLLQAGSGDQPDQDEVKEVYVEGCMEGDPELRTFCSCSFDYIINNYGMSGFADIVRNVQEWGYDDRIDKAELSCRQWAL